MLVDADLGTDIAAAQPIDPASRAEVLARYRHLREISKQHHAAAMKFMSGDALISQARRLGLAQGKTLVLNKLDDMNMAVDLAIHTAPQGRSRAIDRYARAARLAPGSDESLVLEAMRRARFSIVKLVNLHPVAGSVVRDLIREEHVWLVDEGLEASFVEGVALATRLFAPEGFAMTAGVITPLERDSLAAALGDLPLSLRKDLNETSDDRRFAEAIYRVALANGLTDRVSYKEIDDELLEAADTRQTQLTR